MRKDRLTREYRELRHSVYRDAIKAHKEAIETYNYFITRKRRA